MEIITNKFGVERSVEKIDSTRLRVMGESQLNKIKTNKSDEVTVFNFEGGPNYQVGGRVKFGNMYWKIESIKAMDVAFDNLSECILTVKPDY